MDTRITLPFALAVALAGCLDFSTGGRTFACPGCDGGSDAGPSCSCSLPPPVCQGSLRLDAVSARCLDDGGCGFQFLATACTSGCANGACIGDPCAGVVCDQPPPPACVNSTTLELFQNPGSCLGGGCSYGSAQLSCACQGGRCTSNLCEGVTCSQPPPAFCLGNSVRAFTAPGTCNTTDGSCSYAFVDTPCGSGGCANGQCVNNLCAGVTCNHPPAPTCLDATTVQASSSPGTCASSTGSCTYATSTSQCPTGQECSQGSCIIPPPQCNSSNCAGCCEGITCIPFAQQNNTSCGGNGAACWACAGATPICQGGACVRLLPNVMLVIDKSGSMTKPVDPTNPACQTGNPNCPLCGLSCGTGTQNCPADCPTRISDVQSAIGQFLGDGGGFALNGIPLARLGLIQLPRPGSASCDPSGVGDILVDIGDGGWAAVDDYAAATAAAANVSAQVAQITPLGGTPTAGTIQALATGAAGGGPYPALVDPNRESFVVLLTDGEPNCDANNPHDCTLSTCECTLYQGVAPTASCPGAACACGTAPGGFCALGCIDTTAVVQAITALRNIQVKTVVIGFGLETQPDGGMGTGFAPPALQAMAIAGGAPRTCPTGSDAECGIGTCDPGTKVCTLGYYQANNGAQLLAVLQQVVRQF